MRKWLKSENGAYLGLSSPKNGALSFGLPWHLPLYTSSSIPIRMFWNKKSQKCLNSFWENGRKVKIRAYLGLSDLKNGALKRFNDICLYTQHQGPQLICSEMKISKLSEKFFEKMVEKWKWGLFGPFGPKKMGSGAIEWHPSFYATWRTPIGIFWNKKLETVWTVFEKIDDKVQIWTLFI